MATRTCCCSCPGSSATFSSVPWAGYALGNERRAFRMSAVPRPLRPREAWASAQPAAAAMPAAVLEQAPARIRTSAAIAEGRHCTGSRGCYGWMPQLFCLRPLAFRGGWLRSSKPLGSAARCSSGIWCTQKRSPWPSTRRDIFPGLSLCCRSSTPANCLWLDLVPSIHEPQGAPKQRTHNCVRVRRTCWATLRQAAEPALEPNCCGRRDEGRIVQMGIVLHWFS